MTANFGGTVSVVLNIGGGMFGPAVSYPTAGAITDGITLADLNGDGKIDIATANRDTNNVSILLNNGDGTFASPVTYAVGISPHSVNAADFDGDGDIDLAVVSRDSQDVTILLNNGLGAYSPPTSYGVGVFPFESTVADFNGDGRPDLAVDNAVSNTASVLINQGGGIFAPKVDYAVGSGPHSVTSGDFDGDGKPDLATADNFSGTVSILNNNGDGTFATAVSVSVPGAIDITAADINGDGSLDLVSANSSDNSVSVPRNDGPGGFAVVSRWDASGGERAIATADFDVDGDVDVAVTQLGEADVRVYPNLGSSFGGNLIAANLGDGIRLDGSHSVVAANSIGMTGLGNGGNGVLIGADARSSRIGLAGRSNLVVGNAGAGVAVTGALSTGHSLRFNQFEGNVLGIDLGSDGSSPNDPGDADAGPNLLQNTPVLTSALPGPTTRVIGAIDSNPAITLLLDIYTSATVSIGPGQGQHYLGSISVTTDGAGHASFDAVLLASTSPGEAVTATAADGSTSEFSTWIAVGSPNHAPTAGVTGPTFAVPGQPLTYSLSLRTTRMPVTPPRGLFTWRVLAMARLPRWLPRHQIMERESSSVMSLHGPGRSPFR